LQEKEVMTKIRLELDHLRIDRPKRRWNLYFVIVAEHPSDPEKWVLSAFPGKTIALRWDAENHLNFKAKGEGTDGLIVLERTLPDDRTLRSGLWLRHTRDAAKTAGDIMKGIGNFFGGGAFSGVLDLLGGYSPWYAVAKAAIGGLSVIGDALTKIPDRDFGFISLDEAFGSEFEQQTELDRSNKFSTGQADLTWTWGVVQ
jgi:hypothetical protein